MAGLLLLRGWLCKDVAPVGGGGLLFNVSLPLCFDRAQKVRYQFTSRGCHVCYGLFAPGYEFYGLADIRLSLNRPLLLRVVYRTV